MIDFFLSKLAFIIHLISFNACTSTRKDHNNPHTQGSHCHPRRSKGAPIQLKHKINAAYETETKPCLLSLLALVKLIFYLSPLPKLVAELNTVGTLPLSVFLENLLIKCRMVRWESRSILQSWTAALLYKMEECVPNCSLR